MRAVKGVLEVVSLQNQSGIPFHDEVVKVVHRSVLEFLQKKQYQEDICPHLVGFDMPDFYRQSLLAKLKYIKPVEHLYFNFSPFSYKNGRIQSDLLQLIQSFAGSELQHFSSHFYGFLDQLAILIAARVPANGTDGIPAAHQFVHSDLIWDRSSLGSIVSDPSKYVRFYAIGLRAYEYISRDKEFAALEPKDRYRGRDEMLSFAMYGFLDRSLNISPELQARKLAHCFENGIRSNSLGGMQGTVSCWQHMFWSLMVTLPYSKRGMQGFEPIIRTFLLYGAGPYFFLSFGPQSGDYEGEETICVTP